MNKVIRNLAFLSLSVGALSACSGGTGEPLPAASSEFPAPAPAAGVVAAPAAPVPVPVPVPKAVPAPVTAKPAPPAAKAATSCEVVREALLTGSETEIKSALTQLQKDRAADADAREAASNYLTETNKDLREMYVSLIRLSCS